jgi:hypothetical protein
MSADEFDPMIERMFAQSPRLADEALFLATLQARMEKQSRWRVLALTGAGLVGGALAIREGLSVNFASGGETTLDQGIRAAAATAQGAAQSGLDSLGVGSVDLSSGTGVLAFWIVAGAMAAVLAAGAARLSQDV